MPVEFKWKVSFTLRNSFVKQEISFDGIEISSHPRSTEASPKVSVIYSFSTKDTVGDIPREATETIERFLSVWSFNLAMLGLDVRDAMEDFNIEIENQLELRREGSSPPAKMQFEFSDKSTWEANLARSMWEWSKTIKVHKDSDVLFRILKLLRHSILEDDQYDRFSKVWRAFNALYNHLAGHRRPPEPYRISKFARDLAARNSKWLNRVIVDYWTPSPKPTPLDSALNFILVDRNADSVMDYLVKQSFVSDQGINQSQKLAEAISAKDVGAALESALLCLYTERNMVEHGELFSDAENDLLYVCAAFLQRIVSIALNEFYFIPIKQSRSTI